MKKKNTIIIVTIVLLLILAGVATGKKIVTEAGAEAIRLRHLLLHMERRR